MDMDQVEKGKVSLVKAARSLGPNGRDKKTEVETEGVRLPGDSSACNYLSARSKAGGKLKDTVCFAANFLPEKETKRIAIRRARRTTPPALQPRKAGNPNHQPTGEK